MGGGSPRHDNRLFLFRFWRRLGGFLGFGSRAELFSFLVNLALSFLFDAALLVLDLAEFRFLALTGVLDLALALLDVFAFPRLDQRAGTRVHFSSRELRAAPFAGACRGPDPAAGF